MKSFSHIFKIKRGKSASNINKGWRVIQNKKFFKIQNLLFKLHLYVLTSARFGCWECDGFDARPKPRHS